MDTLTFLQTILPTGGYKYAAIWHDRPDHPRGGFFIHQAFSDIDDLADHIATAAGRGRTVYHACASFKEVLYATTASGREYVAGRKQDNTAFAKSLWLDIDVKTDTYATQRDAARDVLRLAQTLGVGRPLLVNSGYGVHAYFVLDRDITTLVWGQMAAQLKAVCDHLGVKHDRSRTTDSASILRPVGSLNFKYDTSKPVKLAGAGDVIPLEAMQRALDAYVEQYGLEFEVVNNVRIASDLNNDLIVKREFPDAFAEEIVKHCQQVKQFAETGGQDEPTWHKMIGLLKHCKDGPDFAHKWGSQYEGYDADETNAKLELWQAGPPSCDTIRGINAEGCAGCERKCRSPIQLGERAPENVPHRPVEVTVDQRPVEEVSYGPGSRYWPSTYSIIDGKVTYFDQGTSNDPTSTEGGKNVPLCTACWVISEVEDQGEYKVHMVAEIRSGIRHEFDIPMASLSSADKLRSALAANRVLVHDQSGKAGVRLMDFIIKQSAAIQRHREEIRTFTQLGWTEHHDKFLLGDTLFTPTGRTTVRVASDLANLGKGASAATGAYARQGTVADYRDAVTTLYGGQDQAACRYVLGAALGAYVSPLVVDDFWHGIPLAVYSAASGYGKTTLAAIAMNAVMKHTRAMASDATLNGLKKMLSLYGSVPVLFDELTDKLTVPQSADLLYNWSQGIDRQRVKSDGSLVARNEMWCNMGFVTTNSSVLFRLTESPTDPEACQVRVMEINLAEHIRKPRKETQALAMHTASNIYGVAADQLIPMLLRNKDKIRDQLHQEFLAVTGRLPARYAVTSRFLAHHAACTVVGLKLGRNLGLWDFSPAEARQFAIENIMAQVEQINEYRATPEDRFAAMMADFHGRLIVTYRFDSIDGRAKTEEPLAAVPSTQSVAGRYAIGAPATKTHVADPGRLFITVHAINDWCAARGLNALELRKEWMNAGLIEMGRGASRLGEQKITLAKGIPAKGLGQARCLEFAVHKVRGVLPEVDIRPVETAATAAA